MIWIFIMKQAIWNYSTWDYPIIYFLIMILQSCEKWQQSWARFPRHNEPENSRLSPTSAKFHHTGCTRCLSCQSQQQILAGDDKRAIPTWPVGTPGVAALTSDPGNPNDGHEQHEQPDDREHEQLPANSLQLAVAQRWKFSTRTSRSQRTWITLFKGEYIPFSGCFLSNLLKPYHF